MNGKSCSQESAVARAVRHWDWSESLQAHLRDCAICRNVRESARWMQALAEALEGRGETQNNLPDPRVVWLRAQFSQRQAAAERTHRILQWVEIACVTAACTGLGIWLAWSWSGIGGEIADRVGWALFEAWPALWSNVYAYGPTNAPILFSSALAAISLVAVAVAYPLLARE